MMFGPKIKLDPEVHRRAQDRAHELGYASVEEYVTHLVETDLARLSPPEDAAVVDRLKGLGYL
jgi:hypothetical protein